MTAASVGCADTKELFLETLDSVEQRLSQNGIDHRIFGSLATSAYTETPATCTLDFNREGACAPEQRIPDIDIIVPRINLGEVRRYRNQLLRSEFPVKLGLAFPTGIIDFRPEESTSYLTSRRIRLPFDTALFRPVRRELLGVSITTVERQTLAHLYGIPSMRPKDSEKSQQLADQGALPSDAFPDEAYVPFREYPAIRTKGSWVDRSIDTACDLVGHLSPKMRQRVMRVALPLATLSGLR